MISNGGVTNINHVEVKLIIHNDFLAKCGDSLQLPQSHNSNIIVLSKTSDEQDLNQFNNLAEKMGLRGLQQLNMAGIAKVCETDTQTVDLILKEILATMVKYTYNNKNKGILSEQGVLH